MKLERLIQSVLAENCYIYHNEKEAAVFDPGSDFDEIVAYLENNSLSLKYILLTHLHFDHVASVAKLRKKYNCEVLANKADLMNIGPSEYATLYGVDTISKEDITGFLNDNEIIEFADSKICIIFTPGHTKGGVCFYIESENILISGDTLFQSSIGRTDFPGGSFEEIEASIKNRLFTLPDETAVYPGHGFSTTIAAEKRENPYING